MLLLTSAGSDTAGLVRTTTAARWPQLRDFTASWPRVSVMHLSQPGSYGLSGPRWRLGHYANGAVEPYDIETDPYECERLWPSGWAARLRTDQRRRIIRRLLAK